MADDEKVNGAQIAAKILRRMSADDQERLFAAIAQKAPAAAAKLEVEMYNFDKIASLDDGTVQELLKNVPHRDIVVSLKAAPAEVRERLLENMSQAKQTLIKADFEDLPPMRLSDVQAAQKRILKKLDELYVEEEPAAATPDRPATKSGMKSRLA